MLMPPLAGNRLEANDLKRQETVFKLLSQELGSSTTAVVLSAVRSEIEASCVPWFPSSSPQCRASG